MRNGPRRSRRLAPLVGVALLLSSCSGGEDPSAGPDGQPVVMATTSIWADVVANVACGSLASVETLIPPGGDAHAFEPSLADRERMGGAAALVVNGLGLEEGLEDTLAAVEADGVPVFTLADHITELVSVGGTDPHLWFDPSRVSDALPALGSFLVVEAGLDAGSVDACVAAYQEELAAVDAEIAAVVAELPVESRVLVTNHEALGYFADRYGFTVLGAVIPSPSSLAETNAADLEELAELVTETGVPAIFAESQHSTADIDALADRVGEVAVVTLYTETLGEPGSGADTYLGFLRTDATLITTALAP